jgi:hypothetical protein
MSRVVSYVASLRDVIMIRENVYVHKATFDGMWSDYALNMCSLLMFCPSLLLMVIVENKKEALKQNPHWAEQQIPLSTALINDIDVLLYRQI